MKERLCKADNGERECNARVIREAFPEQIRLRAWFCKDGVYRVRCRICEEKYTGETGGLLHKRMYKHLYDYEQGAEEASALSKHYMDEHPGQAMQLELIEWIPACGHVDRKCKECVRQRTTDSSINRRSEGAQKIVELHWD